MTFGYFLALLLLIGCGSAQKKTEKHILVLYWPGYECEQLRVNHKFSIDKQCDEEVLELWDQYLFHNLVRVFS